MTSPDPPSRLARKLGTTEATLIGLGSMIGAGVFVVFGLAARAAGGWLLLGLLLAAVVAVCNALSSAQLASLHPSSGGAYVYGRERLGPTWGFLAGWGFVFGKTASCAAMALAIGSYLTPSAAKAVALVSVAVLSATNYLGVTRTARAVSVLVPSVVGVLLLVVVSGLGSDAFDPDRLWEPAPRGAAGVLQAGALIFFAFAGYARIGTLGEEVRQPERTIPRAMVLAVSVTLLLYTMVAVAALGTLGAGQLSTAASPLADVTRIAGWGWAGVVVRSGAVVAASGALLTLLAGISRTVFAMAQNRDLPRWLGAVHEQRKTPHRAEIVVGLSVMALLLLTDLSGAVGLSSFLVLWYYAVANLAALRLDPTERRWPRFISIMGLVGCLGLGLSLSPATVALGVALLVVGGLGSRLRSQPS
ncbi:MAG TPA: amino acid permease [Acidimicrobiia bacterium]|nr:amino acid permease [Acidimicrobiia bacterium]